MNVPPPVLAWCRENGYGEVTGRQAVAGGCINNGARLQTSSGSRLFLKQNPSAPAEMFAREAEGLRALRVDGAPKAPEPLLHSEDFLLTEDLQPASPQRGYWEAFGRQLAALHDYLGPAFGFEHDNYLGATPQPNPWTDDGCAFFAEQRILYQARLAVQNGLLVEDDLSMAESLGRRLKDLVPDQPPSLLHGDLWSGNALSGPRGEPAFIDPAAHFGWAEAELGMTRLFGGFPEAFYAAYVEARPLESGWRERLSLYNLYHVLNHLNLFGSGYLSQARSLLRAHSA